MALERTINQLLEKQYKPCPETVVFDIDATLSYRDYKVDRPQISSRSTFVREDSEYGGEHLHLVPNMSDLFMMVATWQWKVCLFSASNQQRCHAFRDHLVKSVLEHHLKCTPKKAQEYLEAFLDVGQFQVFSESDITYRTHNEEEWIKDEKQNAHVEDGGWRKDMRKCATSGDHNDAILIDDARHNAFGFQYPFIQVSWNALYQVKTNLNEYYQEIQQNMQYVMCRLCWTKDDVAFYIAGILHRCKILLGQVKDQNQEQEKESTNSLTNLDKRKVPHLRSALDQVLRKQPDEPDLEKHHSPELRPSPWNIWIETNPHVHNLIQEARRLELLNL
jgi:hypothetical protein